MSKVSHSLWSKCRDVALAAAVHPFVVSLFRGTLNDNAFRSYIGQDALYLLSFKKAYTRAAELCSKSKDSYGKEKFETLCLGVDHELELHKKLSEKLSIDLKRIRPLPQTQLYTEFLDKAGFMSVAHICASMVPCMSLYAFLGKRGNDQYKCKESIYSWWVDEYSSDEFQNLSSSLEHLLDYYADMEGLEYLNLLPQYSRAMELELAFFSAHETRNWSGLNPSFIFVDFDNTLTNGDTISILVNAALHAQKRSPQDMTILETQYCNNFNEFLSRNLSVPPTISPSFQDTKFKQFCNELSSFDTVSLPTVEDNKVLSGLTKEDIRQLGYQDVKMQANANHWLNYSLRRQSIHILSLNWSRILIRSSLNTANTAGTAYHHNHTLKPLLVHANELEFNESEGERGLSTGRLVRSVIGANDKARVIAQVVDDASHEMNGHGDTLKSGPTVYIGDSVQDLPALLAVDVGILFNASTKIREVCQTFGINLRPLDDIVLNGHLPSSPKTDATNGSHVVTLYLAESWAHIGCCLYGKQYYSEWMALLHGNACYAFPNNNEAVPLQLPRVAVVAGSDSGGGAGIQADMKTCDALGAFSTTSITAVTSQNTHTVAAVSVLDPSHIKSQLQSVLEDIGADALKTGMLPSESVAQEVVRAIVDYSVPNIVVDPVMVTSSGSRLMCDEDVEGIRKVLFPLALVVTPNLEEARVLLECDPIVDVAGMESAAEKLYQFGAGYVLVKGGHLVVQSNDSSSSSAPPPPPNVIDVLYDGTRFHHIVTPTVITSNSHGTGCTLASAIAAHLAKGLDVPSAVRGARNYLQDTLRRSASLRIGSGAHGPMYHMAPVMPTALRLMSTYRGVSGGRSGSGRLYRNEGGGFHDLSAYVVTDSSLNTERGISMEVAVSAAVAGGATVVQLREKSLNTGELYQLATRVHAITKAAGVPLIINDRIDVALAVGAEGVHVGQTDMPAKEARRILGPDFILGVTVRSLDQAREAEENGASYLGVGAVFPTKTKTDTTLVGLDMLRFISSASSLPVVAIGGIELGSKVEQALCNGAAGVAVVNAVFGATDIKLAVETLVSDINRVRKSFHSSIK